MNIKKLSVAIAWVLVFTLLLEVSAHSAAKSCKFSWRKTVHNGAPNVGENATFTIKLTNSGPNDATHVEAGNILPDGVTYVSHNATTGTYYSTTDVWDIRYLANGSSATLAITATANVAGTTETFKQNRLRLAWVPRRAKIEPEVPAVTPRKPSTFEGLMRDRFVVESVARNYRLVAIALGGVGALGILGGLKIRSGMTVLLGLSSAAGAWWCWNESEKYAERAKILREELEGHALLNFQNKGDRLVFRIQMPSAEVNSETGQLRWNLVNYTF